MIQSTPKTLRLKILLAEDSLINQKVAVNQLRVLDYEADIAANGQEVLNLLAQTPYDLILMDCQMPVMDGYETSRRIRALENNHKQIVIVAMTANAMKEDRVMCLNAGMDDYLSKPVRKEELAAKLAHWSQIIQAKKCDQNNGFTYTACLNQDGSCNSLSDALINWDYLHEVSGNDRELEKEFLQTLVETLPEHLEKLEIAISRNDCLNVGREAHLIKGSSGSVGAISLESLAAQLEARAEQERLEDAADLFLELINYFSRIQKFLSIK